MCYRKSNRLCGDSNKCGDARGSSRVPDDSSWKLLFAKNQSPFKQLMLSFFEPCPTWGDLSGKLPFQASLAKYPSDALSFLLMTGLILLSHVRVSFYRYRSASLASLTLQRPFRTNLSSNLGELKALSVFQAGSWIRSHSRCLGIRGGEALNRTWRHPTKAMRGNNWLLEQSHLNFPWGTGDKFFLRLAHPPQFLHQRFSSPEPSLLSPRQKYHNRPEGILAVVHRVHLLFTGVFTDLVVEGFPNSLYEKNT